MRALVVIKLVLGFLLAFVGLSCSALAVGLTVSPSKPEDSQYGVPILILSVVVFALPGLLLSWAGLRARNYDRRLAQVIAMGHAASRLPLQEVAAQLRITPARVRELLLDAIARGKMTGRLDYERGVFISDSAHQGVRQVSRSCAACGGVSEVIVTSGSTPTCNFCGQVLA